MQKVRVGSWLAPRDPGEGDRFLPSCSVGISLWEAMVQKPLRDDRGERMRSLNGDPGGRTRSLAPHPAHSSETPGPGYSRLFLFHPPR